MKRSLHALKIGVMIFALASTSAVASEVYTVKKGDTLWGIARHYKISVDDIKRSNDLDDSKPLQIDAKLVIPTTAEDGVEATSAEKAAVRFGPRLAHNMETAAKANAGNVQAQNTIVRTALGYRGSRYVRGGSSRSGFDCSGFTKYVYSQHGVKLPHSSKSQASCGKAVSRNDLKAGDLVFFATNGRGISHVGLYVGDGKFIHASTPKRGVLVSSLSEKYYASRYSCARRVL